MTLRRRTLLLSGLAALALPRAAPAGASAVKLRDLYAKDGSLSDLALSLDGQRATFAGFMAPPLKAGARFFVLTRRPMATCPFCESAADWPDDILPVHTKRTVEVIPFNVALSVRGVFEIGDRTDPETGFFSKLRLTDAVHV